MRVTNGAWKRRAQWSALLLFTCFATSSLFGQSGKASIVGVATDGSGAVVHGVSITARSAETGFTITATSNESGTYSIPLIAVGNYSVTAQKDGFKTSVQSILLTADKIATVDFKLELGAVSEKVTVEANSQLIETETAQLGQVIQEKAITELPLNGRNPASLVLLTPGTVDVLSVPGAGAHQSYTTFPTETGASANGGRQGSTYYLLDGSYNMDNYHLLAAPFPNPDATQEFRVIGNNFDPRYGFAPGAVVSIVTKSGTNNWHGNAFEFLRNTVLNSRDYFSDGRDNLNRNQFGGSIGGPIKKDKLFVFGNYQGTREKRAVAGTPTWVPSNAMLAGDFSALLDPEVMGANTVQLKDPETGLPFLDNQIDPTRYSAAALHIEDSLPRSDDPLGKVFVRGYTAINNYNEFTIRTDYNLNDRHRISGRAFVNLFGQPAQSKSLLNSDRSWDASWHNYNGSYTWTISPNIVNNLVGAYTKMNSTSVSGIRDKDGNRICYSQFINVQDPPDSPCTIEALWTNNFGFGQNFNGIQRNTWTFSDSVNISKGKHLMVAGVDVLRQYWNLGTDWLALPIIWFDGTYTGNDFADFLLGKVGGYQQGGGEYQQIHATQFAPYFADQIKVTPNLTLSFGVRWEPFLAPTVPSGRIAVWSPGQQSTRYPNAPEGIVYPGDAGVPSGSGLRSTYNYFNPRLGVAWRPSFLKNTSIRAAFGIFSMPVDYGSWNHTGDVAPFSPSYSIIHNQAPYPDINFADPWASFAGTGGVSPFPPFSSPGYAPDASASYVFPVTMSAVFSPDYKMAQNQTWNLSIDHQFGQNWMAHAAYVGAQAYHMPVGVEHNPGIYANGGLRAYSNFDSVFQSDTIGTSSYHSAQFTVDRKFAHGFQITGNYTYSKTLDTTSSGSLTFGSSGLYNPFDVRANRGISQLNIPHVVVVNFLYQTPELAGMNGFARSFLGGWQLSGIWRAQSGTPITIYDYNNNSGSNVGLDHADFKSGETAWSHRGDKSQWINQYFNTAAFTDNAPGTFGNTPRGIFQGPGINTWDLGMGKNWKLTEAYKLQFRWEMFNALNTPSFANPNNNLHSGNFGKITAMGGVAPRVMQAALKFSF
ncbi:MAG: carboxypeptidase regulatory-like domain-containing protein [Acidobacteria bacterium]|nr:carboxypeptidase regulatory-like domain-containing protein [Acidobacteriota bacterium]